MLIRAGHTRADVHDMTLAQLRAYSQAAERARKRDHRDQLVLLLAAERLDKPALTSLLDRLEP